MKKNSKRIKIEIFLQHKSYTVNYLKKNRVSTNKLGENKLHQESPKSKFRKFINIRT